MRNHNGAARPLSPKAQKFCLCIVEGDNPSEAYKCSYGAQEMSADAVSTEAQRLLRDPRVKKRVAELRESLQTSLGVSRASLLREIDEARELSRTHGDAKALLSATMAKAKLLGFIDAPAKPTSRSEREVFGVFDLAGKAE